MTCLPKKLSDLLGEGLTYEGWEKEVNSLKVGILEGRSVERELDAMRRKQRFHLGDRSFPELVSLDALRANGLNYSGWEKDFKKAEDCAIRHPILVKGALEKMQRRQGLHDGSIEFPAGLEIIISFAEEEELAYESWEQDVARAKRNAIDGRDVQQDVEAMRRMQRLHLGDRSFIPELESLDALRASGLNYSGWEKDFKKAEDLAARRPILVEGALEKMQRRQGLHDGTIVSSELIRLDALRASGLEYSGWEKDVKEAENVAYRYPDLAKGALEKMQRRHENFLKQKANSDIIVSIKLLTRTWGFGSDDIYRVIRSFLVKHKEPRKLPRHWKSPDVAKAYKELEVCGSFWGRNERERSTSDAANLGIFLKRTEMNQNFQASASRQENAKKRHIKRIREPKKRLFIA